MSDQSFKARSANIEKFVQISGSLVKYFNNINLFIIRKRHREISFKTKQKHLLSLLPIGIPIICLCNLVPNVMKYYLKSMVMRHIRFDKTRLKVVCGYQKQTMYSYYYKKAKESLFSGKTKKNISNCHLLKLLSSMLSYSMLSYRIISYCSTSKRRVNALNRLYGMRSKIKGPITKTCLYNFDPS